MKEIFKAILKYLFVNTKLDEKADGVLEIAKTEVTKLDEKFNDLKEKVETKNEEVTKGKIIAPKKKSKYKKS